MSQSNASHSKKRYSYKAFLNHKLQSRLHRVHNHIINSNFTVCLRELWPYKTAPSLPLSSSLPSCSHPSSPDSLPVSSCPSPFFHLSLLFILLPVFHVLHFLLLLLFLPYISFYVYYSSSFSSSPPSSPYNCVTAVWKAFFFMDKRINCGFECNSQVWVN